MTPKIKKYIVSIDSSSSACKSYLIDLEGKVHNSISIPLNIFNPKENWYEHDPIELWNKQKLSLEELLKNVDLEEIIGIGITNQRETIIIWDKETKKPIYPAISWQDSRNSSFIERYEPYKEIIRKKTGLYINLYFSAPKINWILENIPHRKETLRIGTVDTWLLANLTNHEIFATDLTNASRTLLLNLETENWSKKLLNLFNIPQNSLPKIKPSGDFYGYWEFKNKKIPIYGIIGDQQGALLSEGVEKGIVKCTYGTGLFVLINTLKEKLNIEKTISTIAWKIKGESTNYCLEAASFVCGGFLEQLKKEGKFDNYSINNSEISTDIYLKTNNERLFIFDEKKYPNLQLGIKPEDKGEKVLKSAINGIALSVWDILNLLKDKINITKISVNGKITKINYLNELQSSLLKIKLTKDEFENASATGVSYLVALSTKHLTKEKINKLVLKKNSYLSVFNKTLDTKQLLKNWENYKTNL